MIDSKKSLFALAILVVFIANMFTIVVSTRDDQFNVAKTALNGSINMLIKSPPFKDSVYTFNVFHTSNMLKDLVNSYDHEKFGASVCITIQIINFRAEDQDTNTYCSKGESIVSLTSPDRVSEVENGQVRLNIVNKDLGHISWFIAPSYNRPLMHRIIDLKKVPYISAFFQIAVILWFGMVTFRRQDLDHDLEMISPNALVEIQGLKEEMDAQSQTIELTTKRLTTIEKIIDNNKSQFVINKDVSYIEYKHPHANIFYQDGRSKKLRCSLVDIENSFPVQFVKINRSILLSQNYLTSGNVTIKKKGDKSYLSLKLKTQTKEIEVGATYSNSVAVLLTNVEKAK